jgi:hypothetical protein
MVIYLDQMEQLLFAGRTEAETGPFWECLEDLIALPLRNVRVVLSLREDYLGRFRDRLRDMRQLTDHGFRIGPLTVGELTDAVVHAAAVGDPPQSWSVDEMRNLILQVRMVGQLPTDAAETQSVYAQIVCRALFQERAQGKVTDVMEAEVILRRYMEATLTELGALRERAQRLLEDDLVSADGTRTLRTEKELTWIVPQPELGTILRQLERSAILRAQEHHGSRYFEIGHDWLARWVYEQRLERTRVAAQKWLEEEQRQQLATARLNERRSRVLALGAIMIAVFVSVAGVVGFLSRSKAIVAQQIAEQAMRGAKQATEIAVRERNKALEATRACQGNRGRQQSAPSALPTTEIEGVIPPPIDPKTNDVNRASP